MLRDLGAGTAALVVILAIALAGCESVGVVPIPPPPVVTTAWIGVVTTVQFGVQDLRLTLNGTSGTLTGTFSIGSSRSGTVLGTIGTRVDLVFTQTAPCSATITLTGELHNGLTEMAGLLSSIECDGRPLEGAFAANIVGEPLERSARVRGLWDQAYRFGSEIELGALDLRQIGGLVDGSFTDASTGALVGAAAGVVTADTMYYVLERASPCVVTRSVRADVLDEDTELAGTWSGLDCTNTLISAGTLEGQLR